MTRGVRTARAFALVALVGTAACDSSGVLVPAPQLIAQRVEPDSVMLELGQTRQFRAVGDFSDGVTRDLPASFTATGGVVTGAGFYTATTAGVFSVVASFQGGGAAAAKVVVNPAPASLQRVILTPDTGRVQTLQNIQFTAAGFYADGITRPVSVTFSATGGSISSTGLYSAGSAAGTFQVIAQAATGQADTSTVLITATAPPPPTISSIALSPQLITLQTGAQQQFTVTAQFSDGTSGNVTSQATFTAPGGTMSASGLYTAGNTPGAYQVSANVQGHQAFATVNITPALQSISIQPGSASLQPGGTQKFTVVGQFSTGTADITSNATLTATGGTITASGDYTAGSTPGSYQVNATAFGFNASATVTIASPTTPTVTAISLTPATVTLAAGATQQFSVVATFSDGSTGTVPITYAQTGGAITATGLYTAGSTAGSFRVIATHAASSRADTSTITITVPAPTLQSIAIAPSSVTLQPGGTRQFAVTALYSNGSTSTVTSQSTFSATAGSISSGGLYTAPSTSGSATVTASFGGQTANAVVTISVSPPSPYTAVQSEDWNYTNEAALAAAHNYFSWNGSPGIPLYASTPGERAGVSLVADPTFGKVVEILFPQNSSGTGIAVYGATSFTPFDNVWIRFYLKTMPGWTTVGPTPVGDANAYKTSFIIWEPGFISRMELGPIGTRYSYGMSARDASSGAYYRYTETMLPGSNSTLGDVVADGEWYEHVMHWNKTGPYTGYWQFWMRKYTQNGVVVNNAYSYVGANMNGNQGYCSSHTVCPTPRARQFIFGNHKNKSNPTDMYIRWGPWEIVDGNLPGQSNPFNMPQN